MQIKSEVIEVTSARMAVALKVENTQGLFGFKHSKQQTFLPINSLGLGMLQKHILFILTLAVNHSNH